MTTSTQRLQGKELLEAWTNFDTEGKRIFPRDIATKLGVSEAELLASKIGNGEVTRLSGDWADFVKRLPELKEVLSITRNEACVLEHKGDFGKTNVMPDGSTGLSIGPIETRMFLQYWAVGFFVKQESKKGFSESIHIYDKEGDSVIKIYKKENTDIAAFDKLVADFTSEDQSDVQAYEAYKPMSTTPIHDIDKEEFTQSWRELKDTHQFFGMIRKYKADRYDACELVKGEFTYKIDPVNLKDLLEQAAETELPIMIFASSRGNIQIHQDVVKRVLVMGNWLNIMDPKFNMHLNEEHINTAWVVKKPTEDGHVTSIEVFDHDNKLIVQFFGLRKPGQAEDENWRTLVDNFERI
ncbi:hemin-degrading factor [Sediminitomix flava]|nr:ChuX/HutX family heme-like substrate-binding protein [Sediminitomix flava]